MNVGRGTTGTLALFVSLSVLSFPPLLERTKKAFFHFPLCLKIAFPFLMPASSYGGHLTAFPGAIMAEWLLGNMNKRILKYIQFNVFKRLSLIHAVIVLSFFFITFARHLSICLCFFI